MAHIDIKHDNTSELYKNTLSMYELFCTEIFPSEVEVLDGFQNLIYLLYKAHGQEPPVIHTHTINPIDLSTSSDKDIILGFSGGLDSAYNALYLHDIGYNVTLMHIKNLNKSYPKEDEFACRFAENHNFNYVEMDAKHYAKEFFIDNPLKNQLILSVMIDYGIMHGINVYSLGADTCTPINQSTIGMTITDSIEVNECFWDGVKQYIPYATLKFIPNDIKKYDRLKYILLNHPNALNDIYSCITPHRFNNSLHKHNEEKYGIHLLDGRCGSCFKCCMEGILLSELGYYDKDSEFIKHCWDILANSKNSHRKDLFNKKIPLAERYKNILNYGS